MHNAYVLPGIVDEAVVKKQAEARAMDARFPEATAIHYHRHGTMCNSKCYIYSGQEKVDGEA
jgi:hypothetical protein